MTEASHNTPGEPEAPSTQTTANQHSAPILPRASQASQAVYRGLVAPSIPVPAWKRRLYIDRPADLRAFAEELHVARVLAIDAEFVTLVRRAPDDPSHRLTLLQFAFDNDYRASYVVDALRLADLSPLQAPLQSAHPLKLFHGVSGDLRVLASRGLEVRHLLDLEAVSRAIFGQRESGLQTMLLRACGVRLDKSLQRADWSRRPLTAAMVAYAARDAEMTYALYDWLAANYAPYTALYEVPADDAPLPVAPWIASCLAGGRSRSVEQALEDAGLLDQIATQQEPLRQALALVRYPGQRTRILRIITDLDLRGLAPDIRPYLAALAAEERAGAARALGRLNDRDATELIRPLLDDLVADVRQAAQTALDFLRHGNIPRPAVRMWSASRENAQQTERNPASRANAQETRGGLGQRRMWTSESPTDAAADTADTASSASPGDWRAVLRARFGAPAENAPPDEGV
ncbi:MAG: hypothetical protein ABI068_12385 [Ktedonobacterales bacterium]